MWVEGFRGNLHFLVCLQTLDIDPSSKNLHILLDRISVVNVDTSEQIPTALDLPLSDGDLDTLAGIVASVARHGDERSAPSRESALLRLLH